MTIALAVMCGSLLLVTVGLIIRRIVERRDQRNIARIIDEWRHRIDEDQE